MTRLIDADALMEDLARRWDTTDCAEFADKEVWRALIEAPPIDAVPVVRCKDCKWCNTDWAMGKWYGSCKEWNTHSVMADWYCVNGERKDDE